jgi:hypothetical protein
MDRGHRALARRWGLNIDSEEVLELLDHVDSQVGDFISLHRKAAILREFPSEFLALTLREAFDSGDPKVRKLLISKRWRKR